MKNILVFLSSILVTSCTNAIAPVLPRTTQLGEDTFGCLVNSVVWLPQKGTSIIGSPSILFAHYDKTAHTIMISANQFKYQGSGFTLLAIAYSVGDAVLTIDTNTPAYGTNYHDNSIYYTTLKQGSRLNITKLDTANRIISGTFSLSLINYVIQKQISVTQGVFDVRYSQ